METTMKACQSRLLLAGGVSALALALAAALPAMAQTTPQGAQAGTPAAASEVVVTGSRIQRSGFTTPVPVTVVGPQLVQQVAATNMATIIDQLPQFHSGQNSFTATGN